MISRGAGRAGTGGRGGMARCGYDNVAVSAQQGATTADGSRARLVRGCRRRSGRAAGTLSFWQTTAGPAVVWLWVRQVAERTGGSQLRSRLASGDVGGVSSSSTPHAARQPQQPQGGLSTASPGPCDARTTAAPPLIERAQSRPFACSPCRARQRRGCAPTEKAVRREC